MGKQIIQWITGIAVLLGLIFFGAALARFGWNYGLSQENQEIGGGINTPTFSKMATSSAITVGTSSTLIQATSSRQYYVFVNDGSNVVYLSFNGDAAAVANSGIRLNASGGTYEMYLDKGNLYTGTIRAIATVGASVVTVSGI